MTSCEVYSVDEVAKMLSLSRNGTYKLVREKQIASLRFGRRICIPKARLDALLAGQDGQPKG